MAKEIDIRTKVSEFKSEEKVCWFCKGRKTEPGSVSYTLYKTSFNSYLERCHICKGTGKTIEAKLIHL